MRSLKEILNFSWHEEQQRSMRTNPSIGPQKGHWGVEVSRAWNWVTDLEHKTSWHKQRYSEKVQTISPYTQQSTSLFLFLTDNLEQLMIKLSILTVPMYKKNTHKGRKFTYLLPL